MTRHPEVGRPGGPDTDNFLFADDPLGIAAVAAVEMSLAQVLYGGCRHGTAGSFFNSAGQLTITVSGWPARAGVARTRKRWPSIVVS
jgi:hypothetical protein